MAGEEAKKQQTSTTDTTGIQQLSCVRSNTDKGAEILRAQAVKSLLESSRRADSNSGKKNKKK
jgi:hypothetical protein